MLIVFFLFSLSNQDRIQGDFQFSKLDCSWNVSRPSRSNFFLENLPSIFFNIKFQAYNCLWNFCSVVVAAQSCDTETFMQCLLVSFYLFLLDCLSLDCRFNKIKTLLWLNLLNRHSASGAKKREFNCIWAWLIQIDAKRSHFFAKRTKICILCRHFVGVLKVFLIVCFCKEIPIFIDTRLGWLTCRLKTCKLFDFTECFWTLNGHW